MANCYENGHGVDKNLDLALKYYLEASEAGQPDTQYSLCVHYMNEGHFFEAIGWCVKSFWSELFY
jgi:TPR repeat protein